MYTIEAKLLSDALAAASSAIAMGSKSEAQSVIMRFGTGLQLIAANSVVVWRSDLPVTCETRVDTTVTVLPAVLASYARGVKTVKLDPKEAHLLVRGDRKVQAEVYYVGATDVPEFPEVEPDTDIEHLAAVATTMLQRAGSIRNRTDKQELSVQLSWTPDAAEMIVGDTHHVAVLTVPVKSRTAGSIAMTHERLSKILAIGKNFATGANEVFAWSDTDYLSITNQVTATRRADAAKDAIAAKRVFVAEFPTADFKNALNSILGAAEETATVGLKITSNLITCAVETGSSRGRAVFKPTSVRGTPPAQINVSVNHLQDCMGALDGETMRLCLLVNNIVSLESTDATRIKTIAAMATRA